MKGVGGSTLHWHVDDRTKAAISRANQIQEIILNELDTEITWQVGLEETGPAFHHMRTMRTSTNPNESVVTPRMRTHDLDNLWIVGSSVFVTSGAMNPTLTIATLALKAADHIDKVL